VRLDALTGLTHRQRAELRRRVAGHLGTGVIARPGGRPSALCLEGSVDLVCVLLRTNLTQDQAAALFEVSQATASRRWDLLRDTIATALATLVPAVREIVGRGGSRRRSRVRRRVASGRPSASGDSRSRPEQMNLLGNGGCRHRDVGWHGAIEGTVGRCVYMCSPAVWFCRGAARDEVSQWVVMRATPGRLVSVNHRLPSEPAVSAPIPPVVGVANSVMAPVAGFTRPIRVALRSRA